MMLDILAQNIKFKNYKIINEFGEITIVINPENWLELADLLKNNPDLDFAQLIDLCGVDYLEYGISEWETKTANYTGYSRGRTKITEKPNYHPERFAIVCHFLSLQYNWRVRVRIYVPEKDPTLPSVTGIWRNANWYEREAYDLYGILFENHPDLRRILTDYGFVGHPFRKDFPLIGKVEVRYDATEGKVIYEPVSIDPRTLVPKVIR